MSTACFLDGLTLLYASNELQNHRDLASIALKQNGYALQYVSEQLASDPILVRLAMKTQVNSMKYASIKLLGNSIFISSIAKKNGKLALKYCCKRLCSDRSVVMTAVTQNGNALQYADESLKNDPDVVLLAINNMNQELDKNNNNNNNNNKPVSSTSVIDDEDGDLQSNDACNVAMSFCSLKLRSDFNFVSMACNVNPEVLIYASPDLQQNEKLIDIVRKARRAKNDRFTTSPNPSVASLPSPSSLFTITPKAQADIKVTPTTARLGSSASCPISFD
jgi:hypothetical protein